ncbi:beta-ketoacyl synthase N-terminal-like domain-containing protein [Spirillospora sp. NPDC050679]
MTPPLDAPLALALLGTSVLEAADPAGFAENKPSFYADPAAWMIASAVERALDEPSADVRAAVLARPDRVATIVTCAAASLPAARAIARTAGRGRVSPLRFAGANPGILAGLTCIRLGLRGPSLVLDGDPDRTAPTALTVARDWLRRGRARHVVLATYAGHPGGHTVACALVIGAATRDAADRDDSAEALRLLAAAPGVPLIRPS